MMDNYIVCDDGGLVDGMMWDDYCDANADDMYYDHYDEPEEEYDDDYG